MTNELSKSTPVKLSIMQFILLVCAIFSCAVAVMNSVHDVRDTLGGHSNQLAAMQRQLDMISGQLHKVEDSQASTELATRGRLEEWWHWRWGVSADLGTIASKTSTPIMTKQ